MTKKPTLLIVDDELNVPATAGTAPRRECYGKLGEHFELVYAENPTQVDSYLKLPSVDAALVDFVLEGWGIDVQAVLRQIRNRIPIALVSNHWTPSFEGLRNALENYEISRLFTWDELTRPEGQHLVSFWMETAIQKKQDLELSSIGDDQSYNIIQVSDLQFGSDSTEAFKTDTQLTLREIGKAWGNAPQLVAVTGDIAETGQPNEYELATKWLLDFGKGLGSTWSARNVAIVPGNHDICWPLALAARVDPIGRTLDSNNVKFPDLKKFALAPFREFAEKFGHSGQWGGHRHYWISGRHRRMGVILFGVNTCQEIDEWGAPVRKLDDNTLAALFDELRVLKNDAPDAIIVGLVHHPLMGDAEAIQNAQVFRRNLTNDLGTVVLLTGHVHADMCSLVSGEGPGYLQIIGSTLSKPAKKRPEDSQRGFNMIELCRASGIVNGVVVRPRYFSQRGIESGKDASFSRDKYGILRQN